VFSSVTSVQAAETSPCAAALGYLKRQDDGDPATQAAFDAAYQGLQPLPPGYTYSRSGDNPWKKAGSGQGLMEAMRSFYDQVCTLLPEVVGTTDNALDSIVISLGYIITTMPASAWSLALIQPTPGARRWIASRRSRVYWPILTRPSRVASSPP
jgi:hypothetical protein